MYAQCSFGPFLKLKVMQTRASFSLVRYCTNANYVDKKMLSADPWFEIAGLLTVILHLRYL